MTNVNSILCNSTKILFSIFAFSFMHTASAAYIDFFPSKQSVTVGETFTISLMLRDINQDPDALDHMNDADYVIRFREDLLNYVDQVSMVGIGLQGFNYLSQQNPVGFGNFTRIRSQLIATGSEEDFFASQVTNNPDDFFTIDRISFVATDVGIANFESISSFTSGMFAEFAQPTTRFSVTITEENANVNTPSTTLLMGLLASVVLLRIRTARKQ